ncbi:MAG: hypothetical protein D6813_06905 [Calditrichaeota bacterium]|nr:MAG: hypothetical protein D6813_06905 [Calditrichota bacterium]
MLKFIRIVLLMVLIQGNLMAQQITKQDTLKELMRRIEILTEELEKVKLGEVAEVKYESRYGMGPAASRVYHLTKPGVSIAGYGEVVFQNFSDEKDNGEPSGKINQVDFLRNIIYVGYRFNDWLLFNSEIEIEHAFLEAEEEAPGEVAIEFGYVEASLNPYLSFRAGMLLVPVGILNELHEPPTFHSVLRPEPERRIIPTTWRANGFGLVGSTPAGIGYKLYLIESLKAEEFSSNGIRSGRQGGGKAVAEDFAITGRLNYTGIAGLDVGASFFTGNTGQDLKDDNGNEIDARVSLFALHFTFARQGLELRGLYAHSTISDVAQLNRALGLTGNQSIGESQNGFYVTAAYDVMPLLVKGTQHYLAPFIQFEKFNTQDDVPAGFSRNPARDRTNLVLGITYKPHPNVAFKVDFINRDNDANTAVDQFNLAVNYLF